MHNAAAPPLRFEGIQLEHSTLGVVQLIKSVYLLVWLNVRRRRVVAEPNSLLVLPVYARLLTCEAWTCALWGVIYLGQSWVDVRGPFAGGGERRPFAHVPSERGCGLPPVSLDRVARRRSTLVQLSPQMSRAAALALQLARYSSAFIWCIFGDGAPRMPRTPEGARHTHTPPSTTRHVPA